MSRAFLRSRRPAARPDGRPRLEPLEARDVPAVIVTAPPQQFTDENQGRPFGGQTPGFTIQDTGGGNGLDTLVVDIAAVNGTVAVDPAAVGQFGVSVVGNSTGPSVRLLGPSGQVTRFFNANKAPAFQFDPAAFYSGDARVSVTGTNTSTQETGSAIGSVGVLPVAQPPIVNIPATIIGPTETPFQVPIQVTAADPDGSETIDFVDLTGFPAGSVFSAGAPTQGGTVWRIAPSALGGLSILVPAGATDGFTLTATAQVTDAATITGRGRVTDSTTGSLDAGLFPFDPAVIVTPENTPLIRTFQGLGIEGPTAGYRLNLRLTNGTIQPVPDPLLARLAVTGAGTSSLDLVGDFNDIRDYVTTAGLTYTPNGFYSGVMPLDTALIAPGGQFVSAGSNVFVVTPVAYIPTLSAPPSVRGDAGQVVPLGAAVDDTPDRDGSEAVAAFVEGVPAGAVLTAGTDLGNGVWRLTVTQLNGVAIQLPNAPGVSFPLTVRVRATDTAAFPPTLGGSRTDQRETAAGITVRVNAQPTVALRTGVQTLEDGPLAYTLLDLADLGGDGTAGYSVSLQLTNGTIRPNGDPATFNLSVTGTGTGNLGLSGDLNDLRAYLTTVGVTFTPTAFFSGEMGLLAILAAPDERAGLAGTRVRVTPVAYTPTLTAPAQIGGQPGQAVPLGAAVDDTPDPDGSESAAVFVEGVPAGVTLTTGTNLGNGTWQLTVAELNGVAVRLPNALTTFPLTVRVRAADTAFYPSVEGSETVQQEVTRTVLVQSSLPAPTVTAPGPQTLPEGGQAAFSGGNAFAVAAPIPAAPLTVTLTAANGTLRLGPGLPAGVLAAGDGTAAVTLTGPTTSVASYLTASGFTFVPPTPVFSGFGQVTVQATDSFGQTGTAGVSVRVNPVASAPVITVGPPAELLRSSAATALPAGYISIGPWQDRDGSESGVVTIRLSGISDPAGFQLTAPSPLGLTRSATDPAVWTTGPTTDPAALQSLLDTLTLTPPAGFRGRVAITATLTITDQLDVPDQSPILDVEAASASGAVRFFAGGLSVNLTPASGPEGQPIDLGGHVAGIDPDALPGDTHTLRLNVSRGTLVVGPGLPQGLTADGSGTPFLDLTGDLAAINAFLAAPGSLTFLPDDPHFSGFVSLSGSLGGPFGEPSFPAFTTITIDPVAEVVTPATQDAETLEDVPVRLVITVPPLADQDGSETFTVLVGGVPAGASLSPAADLGGGTWEVQPGDLANLTFTPPPLFAGVVTLQVRVRTVDVPPVTTLGVTGSGPSVAVSPPVPLRVTVLARTTTVTLNGGSVPENSPTGTVVGQVVATGGHLGETFTFQRAAGGGYDFTVDPDGTIRVGSQNPDYEFLNQFDLPVDVIGSRGTRLTHTFLITITNVNEPPVIAGPAAIAAREDTPTPIGGLVVTDPDAGTAPVQVRLQVDRGTLTAVVLPGVTVAGSGTGTVQLTGSLADLNTLFAGNGLTYRPDSHYAGADTLLVRADDLGNSGAGSPLSAQIARPFVVAPVADPPHLTAADVTGNEDEAIPLSLAAVPGDTIGADTLAVFVDGVPAGAGLTSGTDLGGGTWQVAPADLAGLLLTPPADFSGDLDLTLRGVAVEELPEFELSDRSERTARFTVRVRPVADPPVLAVADAAGNEGDSIPLSLAAAPTDGDGSESVVLRLFGLPTTMTLSAGSFDPDLEAWLLTPGQLAGLRVLATQDTGGGPIPITVVVTSTEAANGDTAETQQTFALTVRNVPPAPTGLAPTFAATAGQTVAIDLGQFTDPGADAPWTVTVNWGDGTTESFTAAAPGPLGTRMHTYTESGTFTLRLRVNDGTTIGEAVSVGTIDQPPSPLPPPPPPPSPPPPPVSPPTVLIPLPGPALPAADASAVAVPPADRVSSLVLSTATTTPPDAPTMPPNGFGGVSPTVTPFGQLSGLDQESGLGSPASRVLAGGPPGQQYGRSEADPQAFAVGREKHPLPPVLPLDQTLPAAAFGESGGDSIKLIEQLYKENANRPAPVASPSARPGAAPGPKGAAEQEDDEGQEGDADGTDVGYDGTDPADAAADRIATDPVAWVSGRTAAWFAAAAVAAAAGIFVGDSRPPARPVRPAGFRNHRDEDVP